MAGLSCQIPQACCITSPRKGRGWENTVNMIIVSIAILLISCSAWSSESEVLISADQNDQCQDAIYGKLDLGKLEIAIKGEEMIHRLSVLTIIFTVILLSGCSTTTGCRKGNLVDELYSYARDGNNKDSTTAFIVLSNLSLSQKNIDKIVDDYEKSTDESKKYYYQYLLAKRTQENKYIISYIKSVKENLPILIENNSLWVSIGSPFYDLISFYSRTNDEALSILFQLVDVADGAALSIIADDLSEIRKINPKRFSRVAKDIGVSEKDILKLMEDE